MNTLTPADCCAITISAGVSLYCAYRAIMWCADRVIDAVVEVTRFE